MSIIVFFLRKKKDSKKAVLENELAFAIYDEFPVNPGHMLFMTNRHIKTFFKTTSEEK